MPVVDHDFHPDEPTVRVFQTADRGVLRLDDEVAVTAALYEGGVVLRHYAFGNRWYKVNVTTDIEGNVIETGHEDRRFAFNCDIATPMQRDGGQMFAVDLFVDVLVHQDAETYVVGDEEEFSEAFELGLLSPAEARGAEAGLRELLDLVEGHRLLSWLDSIVPFGLCDPPPAVEMTRAAVPSRLQPHLRSTW